MFLLNLVAVSGLLMGICIKISLILSAVLKITNFADCITLDKRKYIEDYTEY